MGQKPTKPTKLKVLEGNRGKRELPKNEPNPRPVAPKCPNDIDRDAKKVWRRLAPKLEKMGLLTETDGDMFATLCQMRSRLVAIHNFIKSQNQSLVQETQKPAPDGGIMTEYKPSPYVVMEKQYYQIFRMYAGEFGLSPRGRVGLSVGAGDSDDGEDLIR